VAPAPQAGRSRIRYKVLAFGVCLAAITYLDRVCISITAGGIMRDLGLTRIQMSLVFSAFTLAYAIFEIPTGWWGDRIGTRRVLTRIVVWWSAFTMLTAAAFSYGSLLAVRFLFGAGEAGAWPNAAKTFSRWFPVTERGTAQGVFFMGAHLSGGLTPLLVTAMLVYMPWRMVFVIFGAIGFVWAAAWYAWFRDDPSEHRSVSEWELRHICENRGVERGQASGGVPWLRLFADRRLVALYLSYFTQAHVFYFYITWLPRYLEKVRGLSALSLGVFSGLPLALTASNLSLGPSWATTMDIGGEHAGVVSACMNTAGQIGGVLSPIVLAFAVERFGNWNAPLYSYGVLYFAGACCWWFVDPGRRISTAAVMERAG